MNRRTAFIWFRQTPATRNRRSCSRFLFVTATPHSALRYRKASLRERNNGVRRTAHFIATHTESHWGRQAYPDFAAGNPLCAHRTRRRLPFRYRRPLRSLLGKERWLWKLRRLYALYGRGKFLHASGHDSISRLGRNRCRTISWNRAHSRYLAAMGGYWQRAAARHVRHRYGHFFRHKVPAGSFSLFRIRGICLAGALPEPKARGEFMNGSAGGRSGASLLRVVSCGPNL